ncbi:hypothetical protein Tco_0832874 [Tanacetum coccineum]
MGATSCAHGVALYNAVEKKKKKYGSVLLHPLVSKIRDIFNLSLHAWYLDDGSIVGDTLVVGEVLKPKEDPRSRFVGVFPPNIARPLLGVKLLGGPELLGGPASANFDFSSELVMKRVSKSVVLMDTIAKLNDPQCELLLLHACAGQTMNGRTYQCVLCYWLGVPLFSIPKPCSACSRVFKGDVYGSHAASCTGIVGIKHLHNSVRDTLVNIYFGSRISADKEVNIRLGERQDKPLRPADMLVYSWGGGLMYV